MSWQMQQKNKLNIFTPRPQLHSLTHATVYSPAAMEAFAHALPQLTCALNRSLSLVCLDLASQVQGCSRIVRVYDRRRFL